jgi:hypothetical protein
LPWTAAIGAELAQFGEHGRVAEVAGVHDQVGGAQRVQAGLGQATGTTRQVGVGDQGEPDHWRA